MKRLILRYPSVPVPQGMRAACVAALLAALPGTGHAAAGQEAGSGVGALMYELLQGEMLGFRGDLQGASAHYYRASLLTDEADVAYRAIEVALWAKDYGFAEKAARRWRDLTPGNPMAWRVLGSVYASRGEVPKAVDAYEQALELSPAGMEQGMQAIANSLSVEGARPVRIEVLRELARRHPHDPYANFYLATVSANDKRFSEALVVVREVRKQRPHWTRAAHLEATVLRHLERLEEAIAVLQAALEQPSENPVGLRQDLAGLLSATGQHEAARREYERLLRMDAENPHWQMRLGTLALVQEDWDVARTQFTALGRNPRSLVRGQPLSLNRSVSAYYMGVLEEQAGAPTEALNHYYRVEERDYFGIDRYYQKARASIASLLLASGELERARMHLQVSRARSKLHENVVHFYAVEGDLLHAQGQYESGYRLLTDALQRYPNRVPLLYSRALLAERLDRIDSLERDLQAILEREPDHAHALNALGYTWVDRNLNLEQGLKYIQRAYAQRPDDAAIIDSLGWAHYRLGDLQQAEELLRRALAIMPPRGEIAAHLIEVLWVRGQRDEARQVYQKAVDQLPDDEFLSFIAQHLPL